MSRKRSDDFNDLSLSAAKALEAALKDGTEAGHYAGEWLTESVDHQLEHGDAHFSAFQFGKDIKDLEHLICRVVMAYALLKGVTDEHPAAL